MKKQSRSILCKIFFEDINNFCLYNPFRFSKGLSFLFSRFYNITKLNIKNQSKIFYKRIILNKNKFFYKKYFKKIKLIKKKLLIFFGFNTYKQLSYFFNQLYLKKTFFLFNNLIHYLETRADFFYFRLRCTFSLNASRAFIQNYGIIVNNQYFYNYLKIINIGDLIQITHNTLIYLKFYHFWFNEYVYSNKLINLNFVNKIILLKKFKLKFKFFFKKLKKKFKLINWSKDSPKHELSNFFNFIFLKKQLTNYLNLFSNILLVAVYLLRLITIILFYDMFKFLINNMFLFAKFLITFYITILNF